MECFLSNIILAKIGKPVPVLLHGKPLVILTNDQMTKTNLLFLPNLLISTATRTIALNFQ